MTEFGPSLLPWWQTLPEWRFTGYIGVFETLQFRFYEQKLDLLQIQMLDMSGNLIGDPQYGVDCIETDHEHRLALPETTVSIVFQTETGKARLRLWNLPEAFGMRTLTFDHWIGVAEQELVFVPEAIELCDEPCPEDLELAIEASFEFDRIGIRVDYNNIIWIWDDNSGRDPDLFDLLGYRRFTEADMDLISLNGRKRLAELVWVGPGSFLQWRVAVALDQRAEFDDRVILANISVNNESFPQE